MPLIAAVGVSLGVSASAAVSEFSYGVLMKAAFKEWAVLRPSMLTGIAKPDLLQFGSCASATLGLSTVNRTAIFGTGPAV